MKKLISLIIAMLVLVGPGGYAVEGVAPDQPKKTISIEFQDTSLNTVLEVMSVKTGRKLITDGELGRKHITFSLRDVTADEALEALLDTYNLYYVRQPNTSIYVIKNLSDANIVPTLISKIIYLNYASATDLVAVLKNNLSKNGKLATDVRTNSLIITDVGDNVDKVEAMVKALDTPTLQVVLEMKIVDTTIGNDLNWGVNLTNLYRSGNYWTDPLGLNPNSGKIPQVGYTQQYQPITNNALSFSLLANGYDLEGTLSAQEAINDSKILANPRLLVVNNKDATIDITNQFSYVSQTSIVGGASQNTYSYKETGIRLHVLPQINRDGSIILTVSPEHSTETGVDAEGNPLISSTKASTVFMLQNGETAVIGGLISETDIKTVSKVPLIGDIPLLGYLFQSYDMKKTRQELTIFITAKIVE
ncbi:MAG: secretin N-terminal domain-containing protein [Endomicrobiales bacterium]